jgi:hypothetical protein
MGEKKTNKLSTITCGIEKEMGKCRLICSLIAWRIVYVAGTID